MRESKEETKKCGETRGDERKKREEDKFREETGRVREEEDEEK